MKHEVQVISTPHGYLPSCICGWRAREFTSYPNAGEQGDQHLSDARTGRLNAGPRPSTKTMARFYREQAESLTNSLPERQQWKVLADELEQELAQQANRPLDGQIELF